MALKAPNRLGRQITDDSDVESLPSKRPRYDLSEDEEPPPKKNPTTPFTSPISSKLGGLNGLSRRDRTQSTHEKPAELFRKDLISAMKLADSDPLHQEDYFLICDPWRQEWERGVQVPVNPDSIPEPSLRLKIENENVHGPYQFKLPKKFLHATQDSNYKQGIHELHETQKLAEQVCRYDLDDLDVGWLTALNEERENMGDAPVAEWIMEKVIEELETQCYSNMQNMIKTVEGLGIEYDENVVCDVCRSPDSEDNNEMVFCDSCDICVHQACYGIKNIPEGSWLCRTCALGMKPLCILCPRPGGAMKSTKSGSKWAHVSCALWIPEVSIGCPEKMEPITKISQIPSSRWNLICSLCRERTGACIQCSVKTCKTAFHVTCAFLHHLDMKTILEEDNDDVQLKAFCAKHSKKKEGECSPRKGDGPLSPKKESEMTEEEKTELRSHRLLKLAEEFYICVKPVEVAKALKMDEVTIDFIYSYWVLKRKSNFNKSLLTPKTEEADLLSKQREDSLIARMKMFIHLRQDLERVRNLCYMVTRREKQRRILYKMKEDVFHSQAALMEEDKYNRPGSREFSTIVNAHKLPADVSVYDQYDAIIGAAITTERRAQAEDEAAELLNSLPRYAIKKHIKKRPPAPVVAAVKVESDLDIISDSESDSGPIKLDIGSDFDKTFDTSENMLSASCVDAETPKECEAVLPARATRRVTLEARNSPLLGLEPKAEANFDKSDSDSIHSDTRSTRSLRTKDQNRGSPKSADPAPEPRLKEKPNGRHSPLELLSDRKLRERSGSDSPKFLRSGINGVLCSRDKLIVSDAIKEKVQSRLGRGRRSHGILNGLQDQTQKKLEHFFRDPGRHIAREHRENQAEVAAANVFTSVHQTPKHRTNRAIRGVRRSLPAMTQSSRPDGASRLGASLKAPGWPGLPETGRKSLGGRLPRRAQDTDNESEDSDRMFSERDVTLPASEKRGRGRPRKTFRKKPEKGGIGGGRRHDTRQQDSDVSEVDPALVHVIDSDSEYAPSEASEDAGFSGRLRRKRCAEPFDENSQESSASSVSRASSRSSRSKSAQDWGKVIGACNS